MKLARNGYIAKIAVFFRHFLGQHQQDMQTMPVIETNAALFQLTVAVEEAKREYDAAAKVLRIFKSTHPFWFGREYEAAFVAERDAQYRLEKALADYNAARKAAGLTSPGLREGAKKYV